MCALQNARALQKIAKSLAILKTTKTTIRSKNFQKGCKN